MTRHGREAGDISPSFLTTWARGVRAARFSAECQLDKMTFYSPNLLELEVLLRI